MTRTSRAVAGAAVAALATTLTLTACSSGSSGDGGDAKATITFSWWGSDERTATTNAVIADFEKTHPNITVKGQPGAIDSYFDKLATETAAGDAPDVMTLGGAYPQEYGARGALLDLSTVSKQLDTSKFGQSSLSSAVVDGTLYGVPTGGNALGVIANKKIFEAAGVPLPDDSTWTWEQFVDVANQISAKSPKGTYGVEISVPDILGAYVAQRGTPMFTADGKLGVGAQPLQDFWTLEQQLLTGGGMPPADVTTEYQGKDPQQTLAGTGKAAMVFGYSNLLGTYAEASGGDDVILKIPGESEYQAPGTTVLPSQYYAIYSKSKHAQAAAEFVDYLVNSVDAGQKILVDRGMPFNPDVADGIKDKLDPSSQLAAAYVARIAKEGGPAGPPQPAGASSLNDTTNRLDSEVIFKRTTPADAAKQWVQQMTDALASAK